MITITSTRSWLCLLIVACLPIVAGCTKNKTVAAAPAPQTVSGMTRDRTQYSFLKWNQGLAIMLIDNFGAHQMSGSSGTGEPDRRKGYAKRWDVDSDQWRDAYEWQLETPDGLTAVFSINKVHYDLTLGNVFQTEVRDGKITVKQLRRDLTELQAEPNACDKFLAADPELRAAAANSEPHRKP